MDLHPYVCLGTSRKPCHFWPYASVSWRNNLNHSHLATYQGKLGRSRAVRDTDNVNETSKYGHPKGKGCMCITLCSWWMFGWTPWETDNCSGAKPSTWNNGTATVRRWSFVVGCPIRPTQILISIATYSPQRCRFYKLQLCNFIMCLKARFGLSDTFANFFVSMLDADVL